MIGEIAQSRELGFVNGGNILQFFDMLNVEVAQCIGDFPEQAPVDRGPGCQCDGGDGQIFLLRSWLFLESRPKLSSEKEAWDRRSPALSPITIWRNISRSSIGS